MLSAVTTVALHGMLLLGAVAGPLSAQTEARVIQGIVLEEATNQPIEGALLALLDSTDNEIGEQTVSGPDGRFTVPAPAAGVFAFRVRRLGFGITFTPQFENPDSGQVTVRILMTSEPIALEALVIQGYQVDWARRGFLRDFYSRVDMGNGRYLTREDIERFPASNFTDLVHLIPGFSTRRVGGQNMIISQRSSRLTTTRLIRNPYSPMGVANAAQAEVLQESILNGDRDWDIQNTCPVVFYLDGRPLNPGNNPSFASVEMAYMLYADEIEGIEFYSGPSTVPGEFSGADASCGVIVIWTRRSQFSSGGGRGG